MNRVFKNKKQARSSKVNIEPGDHQEEHACMELKQDVCKVACCEFDACVDCALNPCVESVPETQADFTANKTPLVKAKRARPKKLSRVPDSTITKEVIVTEVVYQEERLSWFAMLLNKFKNGKFFKKIQKYKPFQKNSATV